MKMRQDAWSFEDDLILAETVLKHIREGSTQLKAFEEVGKILGRTSAACGFRWNSKVRKNYVREFIQAKSERVSKYVKKTKSDDMKMIKEKIEELQAINDKLENRIKRLLDELSQKNLHIETLKQQLISQNPTAVYTDDYHQFLTILKRAREMGVFDRIS